MLKSCAKTTTILSAVLMGTMFVPSFAKADNNKWPKMFGSLEFKRKSFAPLPQWQHILSQLKSEEEIFKKCAEEMATCPNSSTIAWLAKISALKQKPFLSKIEEVNRYVNKNWQYKLDETNFHEEDYWTTPLEFLKQSGDCEDYAIMKFVSLRMLGIKNEDMKVMIVKDPIRNLAHAVLAVKDGENVYILDNLYNLVKKHENVLQYVPQYSVNETDRWVYLKQHRAALK